MNAFSERVNHSTQRVMQMTAIKTYCIIGVQPSRTTFHMRNSIVVQKNMCLAVIQPVKQKSKFCQGPALGALSVLSWFNVSLVVLCLNTLLCLCLCLPCVPVIPPPCFPWSRPLV